MTYIKYTTMTRHVRKDERCRVRSETLVVDHQVAYDSVMDDPISSPRKLPLLHLEPCMQQRRSRYDPTSHPAHHLFSLYKNSLPFPASFISRNTNIRSVMATRTVQVGFPLLLLLSSLLAASSSGSDPEKTRCVMECRGTSEREAGREQEREEEAEGEAREHNPYYFGERSYEHWSRSEHGRFKVLERFSRRSELLIGIENYRLAIMEAEPETFIMPSHWDAEEVFYVMEGND